jgi:hypothetical protein
MSENRRIAGDVTQGIYTDPGEWVDLFQALPRDTKGLCRIVQGLLIHDYYGGLLYGEPPWGDHLPTRETKPVEERMGEIMATCNQPLLAARPVDKRTVGTCRDFALMLCSMLRYHGIPAHVRCGFARYFGGDGYEDHWLVEYWDERWLMADAQLDEAHRQHLGIDFPIENLPEGAFLPATTAWQMMRRGLAPADDFGQGDVTGEWFMHMNLIRDALSVAGQEVSDWDRWRDAPEAQRILDDETRALCDQIADFTTSATTADYVKSPPWA